jgi:hypothetical protein
LFFYYFGIIFKPTEVGREQRERERERERETGGERRRRRREMAS